MERGRDYLYVVEKIQKKWNFILRILSIPDVFLFDQFFIHKVYNYSYEITITDNRYFWREKCTMCKINK